MKRPAATDRNRDARELQALVLEFSGRADTSEIRTLASIMRRWPQMRAVTKHALFAAVVVEYGPVLEVENVPAA